MSVRHHVIPPWRRLLAGGLAGLALLAGLMGLLPLGAAADPPSAASRQYRVGLAGPPPDDTAPPVLVQVVPAAGSVVHELTQIEVFFDENVEGVEAADLRIGGLAATNLVAYSPRNYLFQFPTPPYGLVTVAWVADHGITDLASPPNLFAGGDWNYVLEPPAAEARVIITEFLADNTAGLKDDEGNRSDWIELFNAGADPVNLEGWFLANSPADLSRWRFPAVTLNPRAYLLVWASGKDHTNAAAPLHTNFRLERNGEFLALSNPETNVVSAFGPAYPPQQPNISYGRDQADPTQLGFFAKPTPGAPNSVSGPGFAPDPVFSLPGGAYTNAALTVALMTTAGELRYTLDGTAPTNTSLLYTEPLTLTASTFLQARVYQAGLLPSRIVIESYTLLGTGLTNFNSNLPLLIINTSGRPIAQDRRLRASLAAYDTHDGRARLTGAPDAHNLVQIEVRGQTSAGFPKLPYNVEVDDPYGNDTEVPLLGLPAESDWVLHNPYSDKCLMNNVLAFELHRRMGHYAARCRFVEVFVDSNRGRLDYPRDYAGVYVLMEKLKVDRNRVDLEHLTPAQAQEPELTGGYMVKKDKDSPGDINFSTTGGGGFSPQALKYHEPKPREITTVQRTWIRNYLIQFEKCLYAPDWLARTGANHYSYYADVDSFVDNHWIVEFTKQIDGYRLSNYMSKDRGGKLKMEPIWDWNLAFGNADYLNGYITSGWYYTLLGDADHPWLRRMICGSTSQTGSTGDPDFKQRIADRWSVLRTNILAATNVNARVDELAALLNEGQTRDFLRWPRLNTYVWPNPSFYIAPTYQRIIDAMKLWISGRYAWIDNQFLKTPAFTSPGGPIPAGFTLGITAPTGGVYYTLDGADPRLSLGRTNPLALRYAGPLTLDANARVFARALLGTNWSGPTVATFVTRTPRLILTEIMYHPLPPPRSDTNDVENFAFVELRNVDTNSLGLVGFTLSGGIRYTFTAGSAVTNLPPGGYVVVVKNRAAFASRYPGPAPVAGEYAGSLGNGGDHLILMGPLQEPVLEFSYDDQWYPRTDGQGFSLVVGDETAPAAAWNDRANWRVSSQLHGSPGGPDLASGADTDADGLPDDWELANFGVLAAGPDDDPDQDGLTNWQEFVAGTDPRDPNSYLRIEAFNWGGTGARLTFRAAANRAYSVLYRDDLAREHWAKLQDIPAQPAPGEVQVTDQTGQPARFYRLVTPSAP